MTDHGEYRSLYVAFAHDLDVHAMSGDALKLLLMLKLTLPATGIGVAYPSALCDQVGCDRTRLEDLYRELGAPKSSSGEAWVEREGNVVWIVNALRNEPSLSALNTKKHVPYVRKLVAQLDPRLAIVRRFKAYYAEWFAGMGIDTLSDTVSHSLSDRVSHTLSDRVSHTLPHSLSIPNKTKGIERVSNGYANPIDRVTDSLSIPKQVKSIQSQSSQSSGSGDLGRERAPTDEPGSAAAAAVVALPTSEEPSLGESAPPDRIADNGQARQETPVKTPVEDVVLPFAAVQFGKTFYPRGEATEERREDVFTQLKAVLTPEGLPFQGGVIRVTPARLSTACLAVLRTHKVKALEDADAAIAYLLVKLSDVSQDSPTEKAAVDANVEEQKDRETFAERHERAMRVAAEHPGKLEELEAAAKRIFPGKDKEMAQPRAAYLVTQLLKLEGVTT